MTLAGPGDDLERTCSTFAQAKYGNYLKAHTERKMRRNILFFFSSDLMEFGSSFCFSIFFYVCANDNWHKKTVNCSRIENGWNTGTRSNMFVMKHLHDKSKTKCIKVKRHPKNHVR